MRKPLISILVFSLLLLAGCAQVDSQVPAREQAEFAGPKMQLKPAPA